MKTKKFEFCIFLLVITQIMSFCDKPFLNSPPDIENQTFSVNENSVNDTKIGTVVASDRDIDQKIRFSIISGNDQNIFKIDSITGELFVINGYMLDYESTKSYTIVVSVKDNYEIQMSNEAIIYINVNNVDDMYPRDGLIAFYPFNGNAIDETGHGYSGIVYSAVPTTDRFGVTGHAFYFNGNGSYISMSYSALAVPQFTISLWVSTNTPLALGQTTMPFSLGSPSEDQHFQYSHNYIEQNGWGFGGWNQDATRRNFTLTYGSPLEFNKWYMLTVTRSTRKLSFFVNGFFVSSDSTLNDAAPSYGSGSPVATVGMRYNSAYPYSGNVDDIAIYNRVLSKAEITSLYTARHLQ